MKPLSRLAAVAGLVVAMFAGACATRTVYVRDRAVESPPPTMVELNRGVWVVEDYPQPVFYCNNNYWRYTDGIWYRSASLYEAPLRVQVSYVPLSVRRVERPAAYVYYRAPRAVARVRVTAAAHIY